MPLVLTVPDGWKLGPQDHPVFLTGHGPDGDVQVSLSLLESMSDKSRGVYINGVLEESAKHPGRIRVRQWATQSGLPVLERITYAHLPDIPVVDGLAPTTLPTEPLAWSITVFVPFQNKFIPCQFDLLKLTQQEYGDEQQIIESIIGTARPGNFSAFK